MSAQVAHDIRSPLAALGAAATGLQLPAEQRALIDGAVGRMQGIADDLLKRYRAPGTAAKPAAHTLKGLLEQVVAEKRLQHGGRQDVKIELAAPAEELKSLVEPREFQRLVSNLVNNSVEAFEKGGTVKLALSALDGKVLLVVSDGGKGMPAELLSRMGQKGATQGKAGGTGLGVYHAKTAVENWGGTFRIESAPGKGTTVTVELPRLELAEALKMFADKGQTVVGLYGGLTAPEVAGKFGVVQLNGSNTVNGFEEKPAEPKSNLISTGIYFFPRRAIGLITLYLAEGGKADAPGYFLEWLHKQEKVLGFVFTDKWFDIGSFEQLGKAREEFSG